MQNTAPTILMADDDPEDLELIEIAFAKTNSDAVLHKVGNGKAVLDYLANQPDNKLPCLIILDYNMPKLNGSEVLLSLSKDDRYQAIPKMILSTSSSPMHVQECLGNGATEYFVKPHSMSDLKDLAKKMLNYCNNNVS